MICSWIVNVIDSKLHTSMAYAEMAQALWKNLSKGYAIANTPKIQQLKIDLASCKQGGSEVVEFYYKLMGIWSKLENYAKVPYCTWGKCEYGVGKKVVKMIDEERAHQFLMGLNDERFSGLRG